MTTFLPDSQDLAQRLRLSVERLRRTVRGQRAFDDLSRSQEAVLSLLGRKGPLSTADLARWEQVRPQSMGETVAGLVAAGLVLKTPDPSDGRRDLAALTPAGETTLAEVAGRRDQGLAELLESRLSAAEREVVAAALDLLERVSAEIA